MPIPNYSIYGSSLENVPFTVTANGTINPTAGTVTMAFIQSAPPTQPAASAYVGGSWQGTVSPYVALCSVQGTASTGAAAITLSSGLWYAWIKLSDAPEAPVKYAGVLQVS